MAHSARASSEPVIFLMGPTAAGKTALSLSLAQQLDAEIVSVDSALVYRGMDIGTAKPSASELALVPHHLIDICEPWEAYSAARFCQDALAAIDAIRCRGRRVLLVGGTMLYFKALDEGLARLPEGNDEIRKALISEAASLGWAALHQQLCRVDPLAGLRIHPNDPQRIQRALEVYRISGVPMSQLQAATRSPLDHAPLKFALVPEDRGWLHRRIERRLHHMVEQGFIGEMQQLRRNPLTHSQLPAMRSVGYRQAWNHLDALSLDGGDFAAGNDSIWMDKAVAATRQLAKRQLTWLRNMRNVNVIACDTLSLAAQQESVLSRLRTLA